MPGNCVSSRLAPSLPSENSGPSWGVVFPTARLPGRLQAQAPRSQAIGAAATSGSGPAPPTAASDLRAAADQRLLPAAGKLPASDQQPRLAGVGGRAEAASPFQKPHHDRAQRRGHQAPSEASEAGSSLVPTPPSRPDHAREGLHSLEGALTPVTTSSPQRAAADLAAPIPQVGKLRLNDVLVSLRP